MAATTPRSSPGREGSLDIRRESVWNLVSKFPTPFTSDSVIRKVLLELELVVINDSTIRRFDRPGRRATDAESLNSNQSKYQEVQCLRFWTCHPPSRPAQ